MSYFSDNCIIWGVSRVVFVYMVLQTRDTSNEVFNKMCAKQFSESELKTRSAITMFTCSTLL